MQRFMGFLGIFCLLGLAYLLSENRRAIQRSPIIWGMGLQFIFAILILGIPPIGIPGVLRFLFDFFNTAFNEILRFTDIGSTFLFGPLLDSQNMGGVIFAFKVLPTIIFFSALMSVGYHWGVMQWLVKKMAWLMQKTMRVSGAESLSVSANIFVGQTEAPLLIKPYVKNMTKSELMCVMTGGMATVAGGVMAAYVGMLREQIPNIAGHLLTASVMSAPAALVMAKILIPEVDQTETGSSVSLPEHPEMQRANTIDALASGASDGMRLAVNVGAMLLAFIALIAMLNAILGALGDWIGFDEWGQAIIPTKMAIDNPKLSLELVLAWLFSPLAFVMGVSWSDAPLLGRLLGEKVVINEFIAYQNLATSAGQMSERAMLIASYALCGFANFSSIAIQIGGIGTIAPSRRGDLAQLGIRSLIGGTLAACMTGTIAGILL